MNNYLKSRINDLNLEDWREKIITIYGDRYKIRKTYDIDKFGFGIYGYEIYDENGRFLQYFAGIESLETLITYIKIYFYKNYASCPQ